MSHRITSRISAAIILGVTLSFAVHHMEVKRGEMGKSAFETSQSERFDKFYAKPHDLTAPAPLFAGLFVAGVFLGAYELLAFGIYAVIKPKASAGSP